MESIDAFEMALDVLPISKELSAIFVSQAEQTCAVVLIQLAVI